MLMVHRAEPLRVEGVVTGLDGVSTSKLGKWDRAAQIHAKLAPPETQTKREEAECKRWGQLQHTHSLSVSVGRVWWRWLQVLGGFCSSATPSTTQPISLYSNIQDDWLRNPCHLPYHPCRPCRPCLPASPSPPWEAL